MHAINVDEIARKFSVAPAGVDKDVLRNSLVALVDAMLPSLYVQNQDEASQLAEALAEAMSEFGLPATPTRKPRTDWQARLIEVRDMVEKDVKELDYALDLKPIYDRITNEAFCSAKGFKAIPRPELLARGRADEEGNRSKVIDSILAWQDFNKEKIQAPKRDAISPAPSAVNRAVMVRKARKTA